MPDLGTRSAPLAVASLLLFVASFGCAKNGRPEPTSLRPASVWSRHLRGSQPRSVDSNPYRGPLFAMRADASSLNGAVWIRCPLEVPYRFESVEPQTFHVDIDDLRSLVQFFPVTYRDLRSYIESGQKVRVDYEVSGRFVMTDASPRAASIVCPSATHHVRVIAVGAYRVSVGDRTKGDAVASADTRVETHGRPSLCRSAKSQSPMEGCTVPLAFELAEIPGHDRNRKLRLDEVARAEDLPQPATMPGAMRRRFTTSPTAGFDDCYAGFQPTGDANADLATLTGRCGGPTGMVAHSEVLKGWQAASADVSQYTVALEAGQCYRAFGVGGQGVRDLDMGWHDPTGRIIARDVRPDEWAVVSPNGPTCIHESGDYELVVSVERGQGPFAVQVWRVDR